eukprot:CAMPEP_0117653186 /NCGR_PEP_ID=MMETSP0804-20121206/3052_1 /TAXON_ID=1074897 /ORGANISM="Tetraselmis astigmatica, Strain CCMP880" /LENGTH=88 /DNA_ID=CAMNT_0005459335 /DNA_START=313 /DNA_END=579 /DNA_ORIENTATION=-
MSSDFDYSIDEETQQEMDLRLELEKQLSQLEAMNRNLQQAYEFMLLQLSNASTERKRLRAITTVAKRLRAEDGTAPNSPCGVLESPFQ